MLNGAVRDLDTELRKVIEGRTIGEALWSPRFPEFAEAQEGDVAVWQIPANLTRAAAIEVLRERGVRVYVEVDDDYTVWRPERASGGWRPDDPGDSLTSSVSLHRKIVARADGVVCSTPYLAERYERLNANVRVCRNLVDPEDWPSLVGREEGAPFRIGWVGTIGGHDWPLARYALDRAAREDGVEVTVFGDRFPFARARRVPWTSDLGEYRRRLVGLGLDVGVRPLALSEFSRSKSDLRVLEYALAGALPVVSPVEPYLEWRDGPVRFAGSEKEWWAELRGLTRRPDETRAAALEVRRVVLESRSIGAPVAREAWQRALLPPLVAVRSPV